MTSQTKISIKKKKRNNTTIIEEHRSKAWIPAWNFLPQLFWHRPTSNAISSPALVAECSVPRSRILFSFLALFLFGLWNGFPKEQLGTPYFSSWLPLAGICCLHSAHLEGFIYLCFNQMVGSSFGLFEITQAVLGRWPLPPHPLA